MAATLCFVLPSKIGAMVLAAFALIFAIVHGVMAKHFWPTIAYDTNPGSPTKCAAVLIVLQIIVRVLFSIAALVGAAMDNAGATLGAFALTICGLLLNLIEIFNAAISSDSVNLAVMVMTGMCVWVYSNLKIWEFHQDSGSK